MADSKASHASQCTPPPWRGWGCGGRRSRRCGRGGGTGDARMRLHARPTDDGGARGLSGRARPHARRVLLHPAPDLLPAHPAGVHALLSNDALLPRLCTQFGASGHRPGGDALPPSAHGRVQRRRGSLRARNGRSRTSSPCGRGWRRRRQLGTSGRPARAPRGTSARLRRGWRLGLCGGHLAGLFHAHAAGREILFEPPAKFFHSGVHVTAALPPAPDSRRPRAARPRSPSARSRPHHLG